MTPPLATTSEVNALLAQDAAVAVGVSGGKDSDAAALAVAAHLDAVQHGGPRVLIHSDLGLVEWRDSLPQCERLAQHLGWPLITVARAAGGLLERWQGRWAANVQRYAQLACVKLILPWSTASMRFCTSELKTAIICRELVRRFPQQAIVSVVGLRAEESAKRAHAPVTKVQPKLTSATHGTHGIDWHPILRWTKSDVLALHAHAGLPLHPAYTVYGSSRMSCAFCILASASDLAAAARCAENAPVYRVLVDLETRSTFAFRADHWLGDVAPALLDEAQRAGLVLAKERARAREAAEARIPPHLLYTKGWPTVMPTPSEARLLADVRRRVAEAVGICVEYTEADAVLGRYAALMAARPASVEPATINQQALLWEEL